MIWRISRRLWRSWIEEEEEVGEEIDEEEEIEEEEIEEGEGCSVLLDQCSIEHRAGCIPRPTAS